MRIQGMKVMDRLQKALRGSLAAPPPLQRLQTALLIGAGGTLGSALLAESLVGGRFQRVSALTDGPLTSAVRGFSTLDAQALQQGPLNFDVAFVVFERGRHSNGRDDAFFQPGPEQLLSLAQALHAGGVQRLLVVVPHAPALLPQALKAGLASLDEGAVAALGFEHLLFLRAAQTAPTTAGGSHAQRLARWWLGQLQWMIPQREQPVRAVKLAALAVQVARLLPQAPRGTRVLPPELLWQAAQGDAETVLAPWLARP
jgi:hypothetical protein